MFLDYACGNGANAILAAESGARLSLGIDISEVSVSNARDVAGEITPSLTNIRFFQGDAEATGLLENSIDRIVCSGMLHHLDLEFAFPELFRILKPGGKILAVEALNYNPLIKLYRKLTPDMRTDWEKEHILSYKDLKLARMYFEVNNIKHWHITGYIGGKFPRWSPLFDFFDQLLEKYRFCRDGPGCLLSNSRSPGCLCKQ